MSFRERCRRTIGASILWVFLAGTVGTAQQSPPSGAPPAPRLAQWQPFTLAKPAEDVKVPDEHPKLSEVTRQHVRLPSQHDTLRTRVGMGSVIGHDWGAELGASGRVAGLQVDLNSFVTFGQAGIEVPSGSLSLVAPQGQWRVEAGDLISELRGLARGARFAWGRNGRNHPMVSLYMPSARLDDRATTVSLRNDVRVFSRLVAGGEVTSDGSHFARAAYLGGPFDVQASYRRLLDDRPSRHVGIMGSYNVGRGITVQAGLSGLESPEDRDAWRLLSVRVPIRTFAALTVEDTRSTHRRSADVSNAVSIQLLRGPVNLVQRFQWGSVDYLRVGDALTLEQRQLQTSASFMVTRRASFSPQTVTQWLPDGRAQQWQELQSDLTLSRSTRLQLSTPVVGAFEARRVRSRLLQELRGHFTLIAEFGRVSPYQSRIVTVSSEPRFSLMVQKTWRVPTPAYGGTVSGIVTDERGKPIEGIPVRLGMFATVTDKNGHYQFTKVPQGTFDLGIAQEMLPAQYASDGLSQRIEMKGSTHHAVNLLVVPLDSIGGRVYQDLNANGRYDSGEGRSGVVLHLGDRVTATNADGAYGFYNVPPGENAVRLDTNRLSESLEVRSSAVVAVSLDIDKPTTGVDFVLAEKQKPVIWKPWDR